MDGKWNQITNSLLEKNHIRIPIQKRFFYILWKMMKQIFKNKKL